jgi:hypothetical protein
MIRLLTTFRLQVVIAVSAFIPVVPLDIRAQSIDARNLAMHFCQLAVNNEVKRSGQSVPEGLTQSTCQCFLRQFDFNSNLKAAESVCRQETLRKYGL